MPRVSLNEYYLQELDYHYSPSRWSHRMGPEEVVEAHVKKLTEGMLYLVTTRVFAHGTMGRRIDPPWGGPIELFLVPASAPHPCC